MSDCGARMVLRTAERAASLAAASVLAHLPAALAYRTACWRGDWLFRFESEKRAEIARNLQTVLGHELSPTAMQEVTREYFRLASCQAIDIKRLRHGARSLLRLVEIRGRHHLDAALSAGKGAIICTGHIGAHQAGFSVLHASGIPVTSIGRRWYNYEAGLSSIERRLLKRHFKPVERLRQRPNIEPWPGRPEVALQAAAALRANEVVTIAIDAQPLDGDRDRAIEVPFLGLPTRLLPGAVVLAQITGAPLLTGFVHRAADYRHQVLEISAPMPVKGDTAEVFERCAAEVSAAILRSPAHWELWC